ncbi:hypothetical protein NFHSH190041_37190 (plasmid) [Shewanella sp. NFH-SH190041]|nr:hypothetical protein NFHSH190041_37190 [Shewanella sp. NFH-SH190041]
MPPWAFDNSKILRRVHRHPDGAMMHTLYSPQPDAALVAEAQSSLLAALEADHPLTEAKRLKAARLCVLALQEYRSQLLRGGSALSIRELAAEAEISLNNWHRDWRPLWVSMLAIVSQREDAVLALLSPFIGGNESDVSSI